MYVNIFIYLDVKNIEWGLEYVIVKYVILVYWVF